MVTNDNGDINDNGEINDNGVTNGNGEQGQWRAMAIASNDSGEQ